LFRVDCSTPLRGARSGEADAVPLKVRALAPARFFCSPKTAENRPDLGRADPKTPGPNSRPYWPGGVAWTRGGVASRSVATYKLLSGFVIRQRPRFGSRAVVPSPRLSARRCPRTRPLWRVIRHDGQMPRPRRGGRPRPSEGHAQARRELQRRQPRGFVKVDLRPSVKGFVFPCPLTPSGRRASNCAVFDVPEAGEP